jgi:toxic protein SymE
MQGKKNTRVLKVQPKIFDRSYGKRVVYPEIKLCGKWLADLGFQHNEKIEVTCEHHRIIITRFSE